MAPQDHDETRTRGAQPAARGEAPHVFVFVRGTSRRVDLPEAGAVVVGRGQDAEVHLDEPAASRRHAQISTRGGLASVADLGSHNGTRVNGEALTGLRVLSPGDVIAIGDSLLIFSGSRAAAGERVFLDEQSLRQRLEEEVGRAAAFGRQAGVVVVAFDGPAWDRGAVARALRPTLRPIDLLGKLGERQLAVVAPEVEEEALAELADRLVEALAPAARAGTALYPDDASDGAALLAAARAGAEIAGPGQVKDATAAVRRLRLGTQQALLADPAMLRLYDLIGQLAQSDLSVLVTGETGTGKENAARALHELGGRRARPFVAVSCAAMQDTLVESELFGHEKGAFSGAVAAKPGLLEVAQGGTVFFDEVGELSPSMQAKLLRALEVRRVTRVGGVQERELDVRVVAATNRDLEQEVKEGRFRQDLYFRLGAATVVLPPLRERQREIALLARAFLDDARGRANRPAATLSPAAQAALGRYPWPGNVRELKNVVEFAAATTEEAVIEPWHLPPKVLGEAAAADPVEAAPPEPPPAARQFRAVGDELRELERRRMREALEAADGVQRRAAELIGMPLRTFVMKLKQYGLSVKRRVE